jgi:hypothetical protein
VTLRSRHPIAGLLALSAALALPAMAPAETASNGTGGTAPGGVPSAPSPASAPPETPGPHVIALSTAGAALVDRPLTLRGAVPRRFAGRRVLIQLAAGGSRWSTVAAAFAAGSGAFRVAWRSHRSGRFTLRAVVDRGVRAARSPVPSSAPTRVTVYPSAMATWYGPGSGAGSRTACGSSLTSTTIGVAHRTLPCGTRVEVYYRGRTLLAPVIDRGPFASGVDWDLTAAAADALGFTGVDRIGVMRLT